MKTIASKLSFDHEDLDFISRPTEEVYETSFSPDLDLNPSQESGFRP